MNFTNDLFYNGFGWFFWPIFTPLVLLALLRAPWRQVIADTAMQHRWLGFTLALSVIWQLNIDVNLGIVIHFIGLTALTLLFGWPLALISGVIAQSVDVLLAPQFATMWAFNGLLNIGIPVLGIWWLHVFVERLKPNNPFIFIMGVGFFGTVLTTMAASMMAWLMLAWFGQSTLQIEASDYFGYLPIFVFPEAVINGMLISALTILHPQVVVTFDEDRYFKHDKYKMTLDEHIEPALDLKQTEAPEEDDSRYRPPKEWYEKDDDK